VGAGVLWKVPVLGGPTTFLGTLPFGSALGATWSRAGEIVVALPSTSSSGTISRLSNSRLFTVPADGGEVSPLTGEESLGDSGTLFPNLLPDGETLLVVKVNSDGTGSIVARRGRSEVELVRHSREILVYPVYSPHGFVAYQRGVPKSEGIWAFRFDPSTLERKGDPFLISATGSHPSASADGTLVFHNLEGKNLQQMVWVDRSGVLLEPIGEPREEISNPAISPDGHRVAYAALADGNLDIWIHDLGSGSQIRMTLDEAYDFDPVWSPDGLWIAFASVGSETGGIFVQSASGRGSIRQLTTGTQRECRPEWEPNGDGLVYHAHDPETDWSLWRMPLQGEPIPLLREAGGQSHPSISPDGRFLAYLVEPRVSILDTVFMTRFPSMEDRWQISEAGAAGIRWSPRGDEIFYVDSRTNTLMAVSVQTEPEVQIGRPETLFSGEEISGALWTLANRAKYDVSEDGQRFVVIRDLSRPSIVATVIENWHLEFGEEP
jgi:dipeptidyl aminopeptidase/acylaminoacyl peptidase